MSESTHGFVAKIFDQTVQGDWRPNLSSGIVKILVPADAAYDPWQMRGNGWCGLWRKVVVYVFWKNTIVVTKVVLRLYSCCLWFRAIFFYEN